MDIRHIAMKASGPLLFKSLKRLVDITVKTIAKRDALLTYRRRWGMVVAVYDDGENNGFYYLKKGKNSDILGDNANWERKDGVSVDLKSLKIAMIGL